jgi:glyoxylase-like metal-dependent hydrolase (beta-lactamase superfamily II)
LNVSVNEPPGIVRVRAPNPSALTLDGTNTYVVDGWIVDPGPDLGAPVTVPAEGQVVGPFLALATPGHSADSVCLVAGRACFTGDTVLGSGSVFIAPGEGSLSAYLRSLRRLRDLDVDVLCPGHGPYVWEPAAKLDEYISHRLERERRLLEALDAGLRDRDELLDFAWADAPAESLAGRSGVGRRSSVADPG